MKKILLLTAGFMLLGANFLAAQTDTSFDEDALFGSTDDSFSEDALFDSSDDPFSDDALFGSSDDDLFLDDGIIDITETQTDSSDALKHGELFENGSIKIGGTFTTGISTMTSVYEDNDKSFGDRIADTKLTPQAEALLTVDARPSQTLRMYSKFGFAYPFSTTAVSTAKTIGELISHTTDETTSVTDYFAVKELFTDFSAADRVFFRFGKHTVTWGTGLFFSPVSDMINTSSIDPENTDKQVDGSLNLRTQITFPGTQNCLWFYVIPSTNFTAGTTTFAKETALAAKADLLLGAWELGIGGFWKYHDSPKAMITASGSLFGKVSVFGEAVYQYGTSSEWNKDTSFDNKSNYFLLTAGASYYWKTPSITLMAQYYYDGYDAKDIPLLNMTFNDIAHNYFTKGHNIAVAANFGRIFGTTDLTATVFGMLNFGKEDIPALNINMMPSFGVSETYLSTATFSAIINYTPFKNFTIGTGPYITFADWNKKPNVALKFTATLGGGKF